MAGLVATERRLETVGAAVAVGVRGGSFADADDEDEDEDGGGGGLCWTVCEMLAVLVAMA